MASVLQIELTDDPLTRGYSGMNDTVAAADLNSIYRERNKTSMTASAVMQAIVKADFNGLPDADKQLVWDILHIGDINPFGIEAALFIDVFGGGSTTITNLAALRKIDISRANELGLGTVKVGHIEEARR